MRNAIAVFCIVGGLLLQWQGSSVSPVDRSEAHSAVVNFSKLLAEEFRAASAMPDQDAFKHISDRQEAIRKSTLGTVIGGLMNKAAYGESGDGEFDQTRFSQGMQAIADGLEAVR